MRITTLFTAAGLMLATGVGLAAPAVAQERVVTTTRTTTVHRETGVVRPVVVAHRSRYRSCKTHWRNHRKVRVCRWRYR